MQSRTINYYDWTDIETFLCEKLEITTEEFKSYGKEKVNLWFAWIDSTHVRYNQYFVTDLMEIINTMNTFTRKTYGNVVVALADAIKALKQEVGNTLIIHYTGN